MSRDSLVLGVVIALSVLSAQSACAAPGDLLFTIRPPDLQPGAGFGRVISVVDGDILVGEPTRQLGLPFDAQGRAYLFDGRTGALKRHPLPAQAMPAWALPR